MGEPRFPASRFRVDLVTPLSSGRSIRSRWIGQFGNQTQITRGMVDLPYLGDASKAAPAIQHVDSDPPAVTLASR